MKYLFSKYPRKMRELMLSYTMHRMEPQRVSCLAPSHNITLTLTLNRRAAIDPLAVSVPV